MEIEKEQFEIEKRQKDEKIINLKYKTDILNDQFYILKDEMENQTKRGQKITERLKEKLSDLTEELLCLRKERTKLFLQKIQKNRNNMLKKKFIKTKTTKLSFLKNKHKFSSYFKTKKRMRVNFKEKYYYKTNRSNTLQKHSKNTNSKNNINFDSYNFHKKKLSTGQISNISK